MSRTFQSLYRVVGRQCPANEVRHGVGEGVDEKGDEEEEDNTEDSVRLGYLCCLFELVEWGVLGKLKTTSLLRRTRRRRGQ